MTWTIRVRDVRVDVQAVDVQRFVNTEPGIRADLDRRAVAVQQLARRLVGVDSGLLRSTIRKNRGTAASGPYVDIIAGHGRRTPYMMFHHEGTHPHVILPRTARVLRFPYRGRVVFATRVLHPGTRGTFFLTRALRAASN